jgi:hypothetical protein
MKVVLQMFWRICLLRQSPAHVPSESWFVATVVIANLLTSVLVSALISADPLLSIATLVLVNQAVYAGLLWMATFLREVPDRFTTTLTAIFGCDLLITALYGLVDIALLGNLDDRFQLAVQLGYGFWGLAISGFILSKSLNTQLGIGVLLALGISMLSGAAGYTAIGA